MKRAGGDSAVTELAQYGAGLIGVLEGERGAGGDRQVGADDAPTAIEAALDVEQVHGAATTASRAGDLAEQLCHDRTGRAADGQRGAVIAIGGEYAVAVLHRVDRANHRGLFADRKVAVAADPGARVLLLGAFLETADQHHLPKQPVGRLGVQLKRRL